MAIQTPATDLFDLLITKDFDLELLDSTGKPAQNPADAELFSFDWAAGSGKDYGTVVIMLADNNDLQLYFGDNVGSTMEGDDKNDWYEFMEQIKEFATGHLMDFSPKNLNRLKYSMQGQAALKEGLFESWSGTRTASWNGKQTEARLMIRHSKPIQEGDKRYRHIESLFIETADGERYKLPFRKLTGGRAMLEHVRNGGRPYDFRGQHIAEMVEELNVLSRFRRANHGKIFEGDTAQLVEQTDAYYESLQKSLKHLGSNRGYSQYFESWQPAEITEQDVVIEGIKHLFVTQNLDSRIEDALPVLARIQKQGTVMKEANIFEAWVEQLSEGTWAIPDDKQKQIEIVKLMSKEFPVGVDALNATEQLYNIFGDDELFNQLETLAEKNPDADCRQIIYDRLQMLSDHPEIQEVINQIQINPEAEMNPMTGTDAGLSANPDDAQIPANEAVNDPATQTEDPAGTEESDYPEYEEDLSAILKHAGLPAEKREAPDYKDGVVEGEDKPNLRLVKVYTDGVKTAKVYKDRDWNEFRTKFFVNGKHLVDADSHTDDADDAHSTAQHWLTDENQTEGMLGTLVGAAGGALAAGPAGTRIGAVVGDKVGDALSSDGEEETNEVKCNMTESGCECPVHGIEECWANTPAMESAPDPMMSRLKTLAGFIVK